MKIPGWMNASGGLGYHLAALRYAPGIWRPFRRELSGELVRRFPGRARTDLVIVGPSGGYCLEPTFLAAFRSVIAIDIDPLAGFAFRRRHGRRPRFERRDFFRELERFGWDLGRWLASIGAPADSSFLFSNLLGQLEFLFDPARRAEVEAGLRRALDRDGRGWVSFHDRFSVECGAVSPAPMEFGVRPASRTLLDALATRDARAFGDVDSVVEHDLGSWMEAGRGPYTYLAWRLDSRRTQFIEVTGRR